jgi:uncharacterized protein (DUF1330 family)
MAAYVIVDIEVKDPALYEEYRRVVPASIEKYGGKFVVRGGKFEVVEGDWQPKRLVILEFESFEQAKRWYNSEEYSGPKDLRFKSANSQMVFVEGL